MENDVLSIRLWKQEVGRIYWDAHLRRAVFAYNESFRRGNIDIAPLSASIYSVAAQKPILGSTEKLYQGLPPFLADSLPDRWGNIVFDSWRTNNHLRAKDITPVDKLAFIGSRGMGALEYEPAFSPLEQQAEPLPLTNLYRLSRRIFEQRAEVSIMPEESLTLQSLYAVGTSAGGQHPKALIAIHRTTGEVRSGQVDWGVDYDYYILKFAEYGAFPTTQVEMAYYLMAKEIGIEMMPSRLIEVDGDMHFLTQRFDRQPGKRVHIQTLAAMSETAISYEDLFSVARRLGISQNEQQQLFLLMAMNILGGNVDDHTKNFSFMMSENGQWHITPAYDVTFTVDLDGPFYLNRHELSVCGKTSNITSTDLLTFAQENSIKDASSLLSKVQKVLSNFSHYAVQTAVPALWIDRINKYIDKSSVEN